MAQPTGAASAYRLSARRERIPRAFECAADRGSSLRALNLPLGASGSLRVSSKASWVGYADFLVIRFSHLFEESSRMRSILLCLYICSVSLFTLTIGER